jgi:FkbM family methyltransferase
LDNIKRARVAMMNNYSAQGEQKFIMEFLASMTNGKFLDLGAGDGIQTSNTRALSDTGWSGVCVESSAALFERLLRNHGRNPNIQLLNAAVMPANRRRIQLFNDSAERKWRVATVTPSDLMISFGRRFEFVSVNIGGMDLPVIQALEPLLWGTQLVCFQNAMPACPFDAVYYAQLLAAWKTHGFTKLIGRTHDPSGKPVNTLLARGEPVAMPIGKGRPDFTKPQFGQHW